jgi:hypothetical protein
VLVAWALRRALTKAGSFLTLQEGLYDAYTRDLRCLASDLDDIPGDLRGAVDGVVCALEKAFGFDRATGEKKGPSTLGEQDAVALLARLQEVSEAADRTAARR